MTDEDFRKAKRSRESLPVIYPSTTEETDESKAKGRAEAKRLRQLQRVETLNRKRGLKMTHPIVDVARGTVVFPKAEAKRAKAVKEQIYVYITKASAQKLASLAAKDGFKPDAETERGVAAQTKKAISVYVQMAIDGLIAKREAK